MKCNSQPCPAFWSMGEWTDCRCGEADEGKNQTRDVKCVQELISGVVIQVNSGACVGERPISVSKCECLTSLKTPKLEVYKQSNRQSSLLNQIPGDGSSHKTHHKHRPGNRHVSKRGGTWLTSQWNEQCSTECGVGLQYRTIFCDRSAPNTDRCDFRQTPDTMRECTSKSRCSIGDWFIGPWGKVRNAILISFLFWNFLFVQLVFWRLFQFHKNPSDFLHQRQYVCGWERLQSRTKAKNSWIM